MGQPARSRSAWRRALPPTRQASLALFALGAGVALLLALALGTPHGALAAASTGPAALPAATDTPTLSPTASAPPDATPTVSAEPTATRSAAPTRTPARSGSGGGGSSGPEPTSVTFAQPTVPTSANTDQASTPTSIGSSGLIIATITSCVTGVIGLIILITAFRVLVRGGYGPFLRALLAGPPKGQGGGGRQGAAGRGRSAGRSRAAENGPRAYTYDGRSPGGRGPSGRQ